MGTTMTLTYGATSMAAAVTALLAAMERFGSAPIAAVQGIAVPAAGHAATPNAVDRKADDRVPPRGRRL
ncbi:MAG TPA: hypothetical protein VM097_09455 [Mycobacteriales bacterium]|nr:hypothetical protein [Mycobacteriales bacterium]